MQRGKIKKYKIEKIKYKNIEITRKKILADLNKTTIYEIKNKRR